MIAAENGLPARVGGGENCTMPRTARASVGGYCYHALNRGNGRTRVFHEPDDYHGFVRLLRQASARLPMRLPRHSGWLNHVQTPQTEAELVALRRSVERRAPYGSPNWVERTAEELGLESTLHPPGRPRKQADPATEQGNLFAAKESW
jgi:hypothetical protein